MRVDHRRRVGLLGVWCAAGALALAAGSPPAHADQTLSKDAADLPLTEGLALSDVSTWGRRAINLDSVADAMAHGTLGSPKEGDTFKRPTGMGGGERAWTAIKAGENGEFPPRERGTYVLCTVAADAPRVMMLDAAADSMVYVNGEPHAGDPYANGKLHLPIALRKGDNQFLFVCAKSDKGIKARLVAPSADLFICTDDLTLPDVLTDKAEDYWVGAPIVNATNEPRTVMVSVLPDVWDGPVREERLELPACSVQKAALRVTASQPKSGSEIGATFNLRDPDDAKREHVRRTRITLRSRSTDEVHMRTFVSDVDASVQYVAITPQSKEGRVEHPGLVLSLHGASVEASGQAPCYAPKPDCIVVCPTNRRPYGFDWEDWGRADAIESMDHAIEWFHTDPRRQYLTGHSMGGHGAWQLGVLLTDRFAAVGPSAGWLSFDTYAGKRGEPTETTESHIHAIFRRAGASSDTLALMPNLKDTGVYILHGDGDDNVPVTEARHARDELTKLGVAFEYHEQPGVGHWWDTDGPGTACVDWPPMFEMFHNRSLPKPGERSEFHVRSLTSGIALPPGDGIRIARAEHAGLIASADVLVDRAAGIVSITTSNAATISLGSQICPNTPVCAIEIDGKPIKAAKRGSHVWLVKLADGRWADAADNPARSAASGELAAPPVGPFKNAFTNHFVLVYGTTGTAEENAWSLARARFDSEQWWYRGNGRAVLVSDAAFVKSLDSGSETGNAIVYGNATTNSAAARLCTGQATHIERGSAAIAGRHLEGDDLGVFAIGTFQSGPDHAPRTYALVGGTGLAGMRATDRMLYLQSGVGIPDVCAVRADLWNKGAAGIECAGFLGRDLAEPGSEIVWREAPPPPTAK